MWQRDSLKVGLLCSDCSPKAGQEVLDSFLRVQALDPHSCRLLAVGSAWAPVTKSCKLGGVDIEMYFLPVPEAEVQDQGASMVGFWQSPSPWLVEA